MSPLAQTALLILACLVTLWIIGLFGYTNRQQRNRARMRG